MADDDELGFTPDEIGEWSERKIDIVAKYAKPYSDIINGNGLIPIYVDGLAGGGVAIRKTTKLDTTNLNLQLDEGGQSSSPAEERVLTTASRIVQEVRPRFSQYIFIDANRKKTTALRERCNSIPDANVDVICGDVNDVFLDKVLPRITSNRKNRALCFFDPYGMHISWRILEEAGRTGQIEAFINFPTLDIVRNILRRDPAGLDQDHKRRMTNLWGDESWEDIAFEEQGALFGSQLSPIKGTKIAEAFRDRLKTKGNFKIVTEPLEFRNSSNGTLYHLIFATQQPTARKIAIDVMKKRASPLKRGDIG